MVRIYLVNIPSQRTEVGFPRHELVPSLSLGFQHQTRKLTRQCSWWNTDTIACCSGMD